MVSRHADSFGFIWLAHEISISASTQYSGDRISFVLLTALKHCKNSSAASLLRNSVPVTLDNPPASLSCLHYFHWNSPYGNCWQSVLWLIQRDFGKACCCWIFEIMWSLMKWSSDVYYVPALCCAEFGASLWGVTRSKPWRQTVMLYIDIHIHSTSWLSEMKFLSPSPGQTLHSEATTVLCCLGRIGHSVPPRTLWPLLVKALVPTVVGRTPELAIFHCRPKTHLFRV